MDCFSSGFWPFWSLQGPEMTLQIDDSYVHCLPNFRPGTLISEEDLETIKKYEGSACIGAALSIIDVKFNKWIYVCWNFFVFWNLLHFPATFEIVRTEVQETTFRTTYYGRRNICLVVHPSKPFSRNHAAIIFNTSIFVVNYPTITTWSIIGFINFRTLLDNWL